MPHKEARHRLRGSRSPSKFREQFRHVGPTAAVLQRRKPWRFAESDRQVASAIAGNTCPDHDPRHAAVRDWLLAGITLYPSGREMTEQHSVAPNSLVIRQERAWDDEDEDIFIITEPNLDALLDRLTDVAGIPSARGPRQ